MPDNLTTGVERPDLDDPKVNRSYGELYGVLIDPARSFRPRDKPRVERPMPSIRDSFWRGREFTSLAEMQAAAERRCHEVAGTRACRPPDGAARARCSPRSSSPPYWPCRRCRSSSRSAQVAGRSSAAVATWLAARSPELRATIETVVIDPHAGYAAAVRTALPAARIAVDHDLAAQILTAWIAKEQLRALCATAAHGGHRHEVRGDRLHCFYPWCADAPGPPR